MRSALRSAPRQLSLPATNGGASALADSSFTENRGEPVHRWVPWIAGFSSGFVRDVLDHAQVGHSQPTVLDPFAGVGTTLVEGLRRGWRSIGFEINPYAALACRVKLRLAQYDLGGLRMCAAGFVQHIANCTANASAVPATAAPERFRSRVPFFSPSVERQVLFALDYIGQEADELAADVLRMALGATLVGYSNYSYEPSLGTRQAAGKAPVEHADVAAVLDAKLAEVCADVELWQEQARERPAAPAAELHLQSCVADPCPVPPHSVDVVVTSPPYLNNYHYPRNTRPQLYWLGLVARPEDTKRMEHDSFGKFWQTVRAGDDVPLEVDLPDVAEALADLRSRNGNRGVYGGRGWANYAATYFNDCDAFCRRMAALLRPGGLMVVVIGNNIVQGIEFKTDEILARIAEQHGFETLDIHQVRKKRTGSSIINSSVRVGKAGRRVELYESAVGCRRTRSACRIAHRY